jgi:hypothetical protein
MNNILEIYDARIVQGITNNKQDYRLYVNKTLIQKHSTMADAITQLSQLQERINEEKYNKNIFNFWFCF